MIVLLQARGAIMPCLCGDTMACMLLSLPVVVWLNEELKEELNEEPECGCQVAGAELAPCQMNAAVALHA